MASLIHIRATRAVVALCGALAGMACAAARADDAAPPPVFGVMTHFAQGWDPELSGSIAVAGLRNVRDELYWQEVEPQRGHYVFPERYERYMGALRRAAIAPLVELTFANRAYDGGMTPYTDEAMAAYARYGVQVLRHYGRQVSAVEVWNEYNGSFCKGPAADDRAATYARMVREAYGALKRERPDLVVVGGATAGVPLPFLERLFARGALDSMDAVSIHPYRYDAEPEGIEDDVAALQALIRRYNHGRPKPVWVTEIGWGTKAAAAPLDLAIDEGVQASFLVRSCALLVSAGVGRIYWYLFRDSGAFATMGLVRGDHAHTPKKAYGAMRTMIAELGGARFVEREAAAVGLYSLLFRRESGAEVRVLWSLQPRMLAVPSSCTAVDMLGGRLAIGALPLGGEPIYVEGPLAALPPPDPDAPRVVADSVRDFSDAQGENGWSYGTFVGDSGAFIPLSDFRATDWKREWYCGYAFLSVTDRDQHPSESASAGRVAAVRRWTCNAGGPVRITARFHCGAKGDGVAVKVLLEGQEIFSEAIGGTNPAAARFNSNQTLPPGSRLDFAVFPGARGNADFDATEVSVTIAQLPQP